MTGSIGNRPIEAISLIFWQELILIEDPVGFRLLLKFSPIQSALQFEVLLPLWQSVQVLRLKFES